MVVFRVGKAEHVDNMELASARSFAFERVELPRCEQHHAGGG